MLIREATSHQDLDEVDPDPARGLERRGHRHRRAASSSRPASTRAARSWWPRTRTATIAGFAYAFPAFDHGRGVLALRHAGGPASNFAGPAWARASSGRQREHALRNGSPKRITWTFDPMQAGNAHLNLELLGATVARVPARTSTASPRRRSTTAFPRIACSRPGISNRPAWWRVARGEKPAAGRAPISRSPSRRRGTTLVQREPETGPRRTAAGRDASSGPPSPRGLVIARFRQDLDGLRPQLGRRPIDSPRSLLFIPGALMRPLLVLLPRRLSRRRPAREPRAGAETRRLPVPAQDGLGRQEERLGSRHRRAAQGGLRLQRRRTRRI